MATKKNETDNNKLVAENRKARHNYAIEDTVEAGLALMGSEVKSLRNGQANIAESYASPEHGEMWLINASIPEYKQAKTFGHEDRRKRKLLLKRREIERLKQAREREGMTIVPLKLYFNDRGMAKLLLGIAKGKNVADKRETDRKRDWNRQKQRILRERG